MRRLLPLLALPLLSLVAAAAPDRRPGENPIVTDVFTADPAAMVHKGRVYLYVGHDEARDKEMFRLNEWLVYSTSDMRHWTAHGPIMRATDFKWATKDAWAAHTVAKNGKFYFYATVHHDNTEGGKAIGVAVSDKPTGPFVDAKGSALITNEMTPKGTHSWEDIDPTVMTDDDPSAAGTGGRTVTATFLFDSGWTISTPPHPANFFPPGIGLDVLDIRIAPLRLDGVDAEQASVLVEQQIARLALVS